MRRRRYRIERSPPQADAGADLGFVRVETRSLPALTHVLPPISTSRFSHLCRSRHRGSVHSLLPSQIKLITRITSCSRQLTSFISCYQIHYNTIVSHF